MHHLNVDDTGRSGLAITFEMQPILASPSKELLGYELLYRGPRPAHWPLVDKVLLNYIKNRECTAPTLFINVSNETILTEDLTAYVDADQRANIYFELTEAITDALEYRDVARRINAFAAQGLRFAIDDFGSGLDGLHRYAELTEVAFVKLDRIFLKQVAENPKMRRIVELLIAEWARTNTLTIAEGIETARDLQFAESLGVQMVQGFFVDGLHRTTAHRPRFIPRILAAQNLPAQGAEAA